MKLLVVCQYYYPEPFRISDICEELVKKGHQVTVLTGIPNYPMGNIYDGYKHGKKRHEVINGVNVLRVFTIPRKNSAVMRLLNYHSFSFFSEKYVRKLDDDFDAVLVNQLSPVMMANAAIKYKKKHNKKVVMYCLDVWPESLCTGGIKKGSFIYNYYYKVSKKIYNKMDKILVSSKDFIDYLNTSFNISKKKMYYLPQYAESIFDRKKCKKKENNRIDLLFAGNIGKAQSVDTIIDAANILKNNKKVYFHIVGDGQELKRLKDKVKRIKLDNICFYGRKPIEEMPKYYCKADAMLVTLCSDPLISKTLPGKIQTYMSAGKPIIGSANGETKLVIESAKCGFCGSAESGSELAKNIENFIKYKEKNKLGDNAYNYYKNNFEKDKFVDRLIMNLEKGEI